MFKVNNYNTKSAALNVTKLNLDNIFLKGQVLRDVLLQSSLMC